MATNFKETILLANGSVTFTYEGDGLTIFCVDDFGSGNVVIDSSPNGTDTVNEVAAQTANFNWSVGQEISKGMDITVTLADSTSPNLIVRSFRGRD